MGRNKGNNALAVAAASRSVKERHHRAARDHVAVPRNLIAIPEKNIRSKHQSYFQFFENKDRKDKKLEFQVTTDTTPPPGFEFVPIGNPELTKACKEISRAQDAMIFIVSAAKDVLTDDEDDVKKLALQVHRMGHHVRRTIFEEAKAQVGRDVVALASDNWQLPDTQEEINTQAEAAMRDLFPRIPNFDKQIIIEHSFRKGKEYGKPKVGTSDLPLHRRVQLAVLAHIRHTHTRYDELLKEADWHTARKVVERICLDILVKWRGDEETGRDQLDDILREVVVISDESDDSDEEDEESYEDEEDSAREVLENGGVVSRAEVANHVLATYPAQELQPQSHDSSGQVQKHTRSAREHSKKQQVSKKNKRGFKRYEAVQKRWEEAVDRNRQAQNQVPASYAPMERMPSQTAMQRPSVELISPVGRAEPVWGNRTYTASQLARGAVPQSYRASPEVSHFAHNPMGDARPLLPGRPLSGFAPAGDIVVGRRIACLPVESRAISGSEKLYHEELKDFLVPSIEPISPHFRSEAQHAVRRVVREEPFFPAQVPVGRRPDAPGPLVADPRSIPPKVSDSRRAAQMDPRYQPAMVAPLQERIPSRQEPHHNGEPRQHPVSIDSQEVNRVYRIREPVLYGHEARRTPTMSAPRVVRGHDEARSVGPWRSERELSPHRLGPYRNVVPIYEGAGHQRVVQSHATASSFDANHLTPATDSRRPLYYEVDPAPQTGHWQRSNYIQPTQYSPTYYAQMQQYGPHEVVFRRQVEDIRPICPDPVHQSQRGYPAHERIPPDHLHRATVSDVHGNIQYLYEQQAPSRDVNSLR